MQQPPYPDSAKGASDLVTAAGNGDRKAFAALYARFAKMVHGVLTARLPFAEVSDAAQDVFATALESIGSLRDPSAFGPWLATIARNRARDFHKTARPTVAYEEMPVQGATELRAEALRIVAVIRELPETYRETLVLRFVEGMTGPEIAEQTGLTHGSVRVNLHRGVAMLRERLEGGR